MDSERKKKEIVEMARQFFFRRWDEIKEVVEYDYNWHSPLSRRGAEKARRKGLLPYAFAGMRDDPQFKHLPFGTVVKTMDDGGRKFIIVITRLGLWVFYVVSIDINERRLGDYRSKELRDFQRGPVTYTRLDLATYIGSPNGTSFMSKVVARNIGERLEVIKKMLEDPYYRPNNVTFLTDASGKPLE